MADSISTAFIMCASGNKLPNLKGVLTGIAAMRNNNPFNNI